MGLTQPTRGDVIYHGNRVTAVDPSMAMVFQSFALLPWLNVVENVELGLEAQGMKKEFRRNGGIIHMGVENGSLPYVIQETIQFSKQISL